jgi:hypothetical protein
MREYGKIVPRFWTGGSGAGLRGDPLAQLAAVYLFTCPSANPIGIFYLPVVTMAHELGCSPAEAVAVLSRLAGAGIAHYDPAEALAWVPEMARVSFGERLSGGDKRRGWILKELHGHRRHLFFRFFVERYGEAYGIQAPSEGHLPPQEAPSMPLPSPSQGASGSIEMEQGAGAVARAVDPSGGSAAPPGPAPPPVESSTSKPRKSVREGESPKPEAPEQVGWRTWRAAYQDRYRRAYPPQSTDGPAMKRVVHAAADLCRQLGKAEAGHLEALLVHRWRRYLADPGQSKRAGAPGYLAETCHRLQDFERGVAAYGTPWDRQERAETREPGIAPPRRPVGRVELAEEQPPLVTAEDRGGAFPGFGVAAARLGSG